MAAADLTTYVGFRDYCTTLLILDTGIRVGELVKLDLQDIDLKNGIITVRPEVSKTNPVRYLPFSNEFIRPLQQLIEISKETKSDFVFQSTYGGQINSKNISLSIKKLCKKVEVSVTPYQIRHILVTDFIRKGEDRFLYKG
ncbi:tyrosine-type recombinase/integrase [Clostridium botulinum]|uniref:tyrosine-type recombinase/integrase n=1 Tax=Clostridium botulinum TaxID=1491 RepID=UPI001FD6E9DB|nr:tyrosine-type recombinase/integrase [Clostridium botulinum]MCJ8172543.1 site-specific integrase [Clostridium botulinum]